MERSIGENNESYDEWAAANMRLLRAGFRRRDQITIDGVRGRIKAFLGDSFGDIVADNLEISVMEEMLDAEVESILTGQAPNSGPNAV